MRKRSQRAKAIGAAEARKGVAPQPRRTRRHRGDYHLAPAELVDTLAMRALHSNGGTIDTQRRLLAEIVDQLKGEAQDFRISEERMRELLLSSTKITVDVRYSTRSVSGVLNHCPVCRKPVREVHNATLDGAKVIAGYRCTSCVFWTPLRRRVPSRYVFRVTE